MLGEVVMGEVYAQGGEEQNSSAREAARPIKNLLLCDKKIE